MFSPERFPRIANSAVASGTWHGPLITAHATIHTKGSWTSLIAATTFHAFMCGVTISDIAANNTDTAVLVDIGADPAGGTTYTVEIPNILAGGAPLSGSQGSVKTVWFPVSIPKGAQVASRIQSLITVKTARVGVVLLGGKNQANPFPHRGAIQDYGSNTATSGGTNMANAAADTKGAWTQLGADTTRRHSGLVVAVANADAAQAGTRFLLDIGMDPAGGTTYGVIVPDVLVSCSPNELVDSADPLGALLALDIPAGASLAGRAAAATANTQAEIEVAVYGY